MFGILCECALDVASELHSLSCCACSLLARELCWWSVRISVSQGEVFTSVQTLTALPEYSGAEIPSYSNAQNMIR
jgi:hypothetical protein